MIMKSQRNRSKCSICSQRRADGEETAGRSHEVLQQAGETRKSYSYILQIYHTTMRPISGTFTSGYTVNGDDRQRD